MMINLTTKIKSYGHVIKRDFHDYGLPLEKGKSLTYLINYLIINSVGKSDRSFYPQVLLEECRNIVKYKVIKRFITKDLIYSKSNSDSDSGKEGDKIYYILIF